MYNNCFHHWPGHNTYFARQGLVALSQLLVPQRTGIGVADGPGVFETSGVTVGVFEIKGVTVGVLEINGVTVGVLEIIGVAVGVLVGVEVGVLVGIGVLVRTGTSVAVGISIGEQLFLSLWNKQSTSSQCL